MTTHYLVKNSEVWYTAQGLGDWFWWDIWFEYGMWQLASIFGKKYGEYHTLRETLREIEYEGDYFDEPIEDLTGNLR